MSVVRVEKTRDYTVMANRHLHDRSLSFKAKGVLSFMLSLPEDWNYSVEGLAFFATDGRDSVNSAVKELVAEGYVERHRAHDELGRMAGYEYIVHEVPVSEESGSTCAEPSTGKPSTGAPSTGEPSTGEPSTGNRQQQNTEGQRTEKPSTEEPTTEVQTGSQAAGKAVVRHRHGAYFNVLLTDDELSKLKSEFPSDWQARIEALSEYVAYSGKRYKNHLAVIRAWARRDSERSATQAKRATDRYAHDEADVL